CVLRSEQEANVGERLVRAVQQSQFHFLVWDDVADELDTDSLERWPTGGESILDDPLGKAFADNWPRVVGAVPRGEMSSIAVGRARRDPIDHAVRKRDVLADPLFEAAVEQASEAHDRATCDVAVRL